MEADRLSLRCRLHADFAEVDDVRIIQTGELLVLGNFSEVATSNDDDTVGLLAAYGRGGLVRHPARLGEPKVASQ
jgi:hypothetical protein